MPTVLITGTSTGIGRVTTEVLAGKGWRVFATMRDLAKKDRLERGLKKAGLENEVTILQLDVDDPASIESAVAAILAETGGSLDAVVHNAGVAVAGAHEDMPEADLRRVMETNFFGVLALTRALLPTFRAQRAGRIVMVSSQAAFAGQPANSIYCASKWALEGWAESIAFELDGFGIHVILVEPGPYRTEIWRSTPRILPRGQRVSPLAAAGVRRRRSARGQDGARPERGGGCHRERAGGKAPQISLSRWLLRPAGSLPAWQDPDAVHPQRHHALSGHSPHALDFCANPRDRGGGRNRRRACPGLHR